MDFTDSIRKETETNEEKFVVVGDVYIDTWPRKSIHVVILARANGSILTYSPERRAAFVWEIERCARTDQDPRLLSGDFLPLHLKDRK